MAYGNSGDERLIDKQFFFTFREDAWNVEQDLLEHFNKHRAFGRYGNDLNKPLPGRGQSELFAFDVLGLDDDLYRELSKDEKQAALALTDRDLGCLMIMVGLLLAPFTLGLSLFFIIGGGMDMFSPQANQQVQVRPRVLKSLTRPVHTSAIQEIIDSLKQGTK